MTFSAIQYLNKPYPGLEKKSEIYRISIVIGIFIFLFLYIFQPFYIQNYHKNILLITMGYGLVTTVTVSIVNFVLVKVFGKFFNADNWKVKHSIIRSLLNIFFISICNWLFDLFVGGEFSKSHGLVEFILYTTAIGFFPITAVMIISEHHLLKKNQGSAKRMNENIEKQKKPVRDKPSTMVFSSELTKDKIELQDSQLLSVKAEGNYTAFYYLEDGGIKKRLLRIPLKKVAEKLSTRKNFFRSHRSYIVNIDKVNHVSGNARNISLHFNVDNYTVPVSRTKVKAIDAILQQK